MKGTSLFQIVGLVVCVVAVPCGAQHRALGPAWDDFNAGRYREAIKSADICIDDYAITASKMETDLEAKQAPIPPKGAVSPEQKNEVLSRGPLNDAAACYFIRGRSSQSLKRNKDAIVAYAAGCKLQYARVWDPKGWFWAPAEEMCARLEVLRSKGPK
ncbi:MAG TPA: hypothetical protein VI386_28675 [Candidatus Sulfotelmatobacter sp.]